MTARFHLNCRACGARGRSLCAICKAAQTFAGRSGFIPGRKRGARSEARRSLGDPCSPGYLSPFMGRWVFRYAIIINAFAPFVNEKGAVCAIFFARARKAAPYNGARAEGDAGRAQSPPITRRGRKATRGARKAAPYNGARAEGDAGRAVRSRSRRGRRNSGAGNLPAGGRARTGTPPCPRR